MEVGGFFPGSLIQSFFFFFFFFEKYYVYLIHFFGYDLSDGIHIFSSVD